MNLSAHLQLGNKVSQLDVLLFTRHLATMVKSGIPISEALSTLSDQTKSPSFKKIINDIYDDVQNGQPLAKALSKHPSAFNQFYVSLIEISEDSGSMDENLEFMAKQLAKSYSLKKKIQTAMLYPTLIFVAATVMGGFISFFILPQLVDFFEAFDIELPITTRILLFIANAFKNYGIFIAAGFISFVVLFRILVKTSFVKPKWDAMLLKLPVFGGFVASSELAQFSRNFGVLIRSGVPITRSIEITANTLSNLKYKNDLVKIGSSLTKGKNISDTIEKGGYTEFPPLVSKMIGVGEKTGKLDESLLYLGDFYEEEIDNFSKNLTTILEPILLIGIGLVVGFVALSIITPIYELTGSIRR